MSHKDFDMIKNLIATEIVDRERDEREARVLLKSYFDSTPHEKWELMSETYRSKVDKIAYIDGCTTFWKSFKPKIKIRKVRVVSGCMVEAYVELKVTIKRLRKVGDRTFVMIRESGPYGPDPKARLRINGNTIPPYIAR